MSEGTMDVLVAGYRDVETAQHDLDALTDLVKRKQVKVEGVILVAHDEAGAVTVVSTGDHLGRKGAGWGGGVGLAVGLFSGAVWARTVGVILAVISAIVGFAWLPWYPIWGIVIIAIAISVIWALTAHGRDVVE